MKKFNVGIIGYGWAAGDNIEAGNTFQVFHGIILEI
jgi:hypothetical protein